MKLQIFTPSNFNKYIKKSEIYYNYYQTSAGKLLILSTKDGIFSGTFSDDLGHYPAYAPPTFTTSADRQSEVYPEFIEGAGYFPVISNEFLNAISENKKEIDLSKFIISGTDFQIKVWKKVLEIPKGKTESYQTIAKLIGNEKSFRAVANALAQNKIAYFIPCHRVIAKNGKVSGYKWGVVKKIRLLEAEKRN